MVMQSKRRALAMLKTMLLLIVALVAIFLIYAAMQPDTFSVSRTARIQAPADKIFPLIDDLKAMNTWNPFVKDDPKTVLKYSGSERGAGAMNEFGGGSSGAGRIAIVESKAPSNVVMQLDMTAPIAASNRVEFALVPNGPGTDVTWSMTGRQSFVGKMLHAVMGERMVGGAFERGLANLRAIAEK
jgi:carbon monoxide dehydrogenase subunit G